MPRNLDREIKQAKKALEALETEKLEQQYEGVIGSTYKHTRGQTFVVKSIEETVVGIQAIGTMRIAEFVPLDALSSLAWTKQ